MSAIVKQTKARGAIPASRVILSARAIMRSFRSHIDNPPPRTPEEITCSLAIKGIHGSAQMDLALPGNLTGEQLMLLQKAARQGGLSGTISLRIEFPWQEDDR